MEWWVWIMATFAVWAVFMIVVWPVAWLVARGVRSGSRRY